MRSEKPGRGILISVENITPTGIWIRIRKKEFFLNYADFPYFLDQTLKSVQNVQLLHGHHLYWPELDVDLEIDNIENPERYPLRSNPSKSRPARARAASSPGA